jgi:serine/threonine-protein kinase RsbW
MAKNLGVTEQDFEPTRERGAGVDQQPMPMRSDGAESISVTIPARADYVAVVRLSAAAVAGRMGFSYEDVEDIKVAVGEVCNLAIRAGSPEVAVQFTVRPESLDIRVTHRGDAPPAPDEASELSVFLIECLVDESKTTVADGQFTRVLAKHRPR